MGAAPDRPHAPVHARAAEAEWLTSFNDRAWHIPGSTPPVKVRLPMLGGGDHNGYPEPGTPGDSALPELENIQDRPHRVHRSRLSPQGARGMDTYADQTLRAAGLEDVARYWATSSGDARAVERTVDACLTHGPDARIDRLYAADMLLPAVAGVDVIDTPLDLSDHHTVRLTLDGDILADILRTAYHHALAG